MGANTDHLFNFSGASSIFINFWRTSLIFQLFLGSLSDNFNVNLGYIFEIEKLRGQAGWFLLGRRKIKVSSVYHLDDLYKTKNIFSGYEYYFFFCHLLK